MGTFLRTSEALNVVEKKHKFTSFHLFHKHLERQMELRGENDANGQFGTFETFRLDVTDIINPQKTTIVRHF